MSTSKTNRAVAIAAFAFYLPKLDVLGAKEFRAKVRGRIMTKTGVDDANASAMYNHAKNRAVGNNEVAQFGRSTKTGLESTPKTPVRKEGDNWVVVNKASGKVVGYTATRKLGNEAKQAGEVCKKADAVA